MNLDRVQKSLSLAIIASEASHIFCCVLPTLFSVLTLAAGLGLIAAVPAGLTVLHDALHHWEIPMIVLSGVFVVLGWVIHYVAERVDCHNTGCVHEPCAPKKRKAGTVLKIATALFAVNVTVFLVFHYGMENLF